MHSLRPIAKIIYYILITAYTNFIAACHQKSLRADKKGDSGKGKSTESWNNSKRIGLEALEKVIEAAEQAKTDKPGANSPASAAWNLLGESVEAAWDNSELTRGLTFYGVSDSELVKYI